MNKKNWFWVFFVSGILVLFYCFLLLHGCDAKAQSMAPSATQGASGSAPPPPSGFTLSPANGACTAPCTINVTYTPSTNVLIFYTTDGSPATPVGQLCGASPCSIVISNNVCQSPCLLQLIAANMGTDGIYNQNEQQSAHRKNWKTVLSCTKSGTGACLSGYNSDTSPFNTPNAAACSSAGDCGVKGIPTGVSFVSGLSLPAVAAESETASLSVTTGGLSGASNPVQALWPYDTESDNNGKGCDLCTNQAEGFYLWPQATGTSVGQFNPGNNCCYELDQNKGVEGSTYGYGGASFQCSKSDGGWDYNGQKYPGWTTFNQNGYSTSKNPITQDCIPDVPYGTLSSTVNSSVTTI